MDDPPDYSQYSLEELYDVFHHIDQEKYPERYALVLEEIEKRPADAIAKPVAKPVQRRTPISIAAVIVGGLKGALLGAVVALVGSIGFIFLLSLSEREPDGHVNWDHAIGILVIPMVAVPLGAVLGLIIGIGRARTPR